MGREGKGRKRRGTQGRGRRGGEGGRGMGREGTPNILLHPQFQFSRNMPGPSVCGLQKMISTTIGLLRVNCL